MSKLLLVMIIGAFSNVMAADASGKWAGTMETNSGPVQIFLTLDHKDHAVSGTVSTEDETNQVPIEKAALQGEVLTFEVHDNANRVVKFRLTLTNLVLNGEAGVDGRVSRVSLWRADLISGIGSGGQGSASIAPFTTTLRPSLNLGIVERSA